MFVSASKYPQALLKIQIFILVIKNRLHSSWITAGFVMDPTYGFRSSNLLKLSSRIRKRTKKNYFFFSYLVDNVCKLLIFLKEVRTESCSKQ